MSPTVARCTTTQKRQNQRQKLDEEFSLSPPPYRIARVVRSLLRHGDFACLGSGGCPRDWAALESDQNRPCPVNRCPRKYHRRDKLRSHLLGGHKLDMEPPQKIEVQTSSFCSILFGINRLMSTGRRPTLHESEQHIEAVEARHVSWW
jgi:hypothetical protein